MQTAKSTACSHLFIYMEIHLLQEQLLHEYYIGDRGNAKQDQRQAAHHANTGKGHQAPAQSAHTRAKNRFQVPFV